MSAAAGCNLIPRVAAWDGWRIAEPVRATSTCPACGSAANRVEIAVHPSGAVKVARRVADQAGPGSPSVRAPRGEPISSVSDASDSASRPRAILYVAYL